MKQVLLGMALLMLAGCGLVEPTDPKENLKWHINQILSERKGIEEISQADAAAASTLIAAIDKKAWKERLDSLGSQQSEIYYQTLVNGGTKWYRAKISFGEMGAFDFRENSDTPRTPLIAQVRGICTREYTPLCKTKAEAQTAPLRKSNAYYDIFPWSFVYVYKDDRWLLQDIPDSRDVTRPFYDLFNFNSGR